MTSTDAERLERMRQMRAAGATLAAIGAAEGISGARVGQLLNPRLTPRVKRPSRAVRDRRAARAELVAEVLAGHRAGVSQVDLARRHEMPREAIKWIIKSARLQDPTLPARKVPAGRDEQIVAGYLAGDSAAVLAARHGVTVEVVRKVIRAARRADPTFPPARTGPAINRSST